MEKAEYAEFNVPTCCLQFVSCAEKTKPFPDSIFSTKVIFAALPIKAFPPNQAKVNISVLFSGCLSKNQDSPKASPKAIFQRKNMIEQLILVLEKAEYAEYAEFSVPTCGNIAVCQLCKKRPSLCRTTPFFPRR